MLSDYAVIPTIGVTDLARARQFYEGTLGFVPQSDDVEGVTYGSGSGEFLVYPSAFAGSNEATAMSFQVASDAFDDEIAALRSKGVEFQTFELEEVVWADGVGTMGETRAVWFSDPDGNILNVETPGDSVL